jgi:hypothetical protein
VDEELFASLVGGDEAVALLLAKLLNRSLSHVSKCLLYFVLSPCSLANCTLANVGECLTAGVVHQ